MFFVFPLPGREGSYPILGLSEESELFDHRRDFREIFQAEVFPFISDIVAFGIDDPQHEMARVKLVRVEGIFCSAGLCRVAGAVPQNH